MPHISVKHHTEKRGPYSGQAEDGYPTYYKTVTVIDSCKCEFTDRYDADSPGFRYRATRVPLLCKCGNKVGTYDSEHESVYWKRGKKKRK